MVDLLLDYVVDVGVLRLLRDELQLAFVGCGLCSSHPSLLLLELHLVGIVEGMSSLSKLRLLLDGELLGVLVVAVLAGVLSHRRHQVVVFEAK